MDQKKNVLITGASSGIGAAFAEIFAREGFDLVIIARRKELLDQIAENLEKKYKTKSYIIVKDLAQKNSPQEIYEELKSKNIEVEILVNNAGFGHMEPFSQSDLNSDLDMIQVNVSAVTALTKLFLPEMIKRNSGKILNVASIAAFMPGPLMAVYFASKAYILSFTEAIRRENKNSNIVFTTLCPGGTKTEFEKTGHIEAGHLLKGKLMSAEEVAEAGYKGLMDKKPVVIPGFGNKFMVLMAKFMPRSYMMNMIEKMFKGQ